jgi:hypothetical protein
MDEWRIWNVNSEEQIRMYADQVGPSPQPGMDAGTSIHQNLLQNSSTDSSETTVPLIPGTEMPSKMEDAEALAARLNTTVEELPGLLVEMKEQMERRIREVQKFSEMFKTQPMSRRHRRAQKFGHSRLHG